MAVPPSYPPSMAVTAGSLPGSSVTVELRYGASDWGLSGVRKVAHHVREAQRIARDARGLHALVLCTTGLLDMALVAALSLPLRTYALVGLDLLISRRKASDPLLTPWLSRYAGFLCIRSGDIPVLAARYRIPTEGCRFVAFAAPPQLLLEPTREAGYVYSAGWAHRDWPTLMAALERMECEAVVSGGVDEVRESSIGRVRSLRQVPPEEGRLQMAASSAVALAFEETDSASGPLVLLDAMALGKAVVATSVKGTRDYVEDGRNGLLVPPGDAVALEAALRRVLGDGELRRRLGGAARADAASRFSEGRFLTGVAEAVGALIQR